MAKLPKQPFCEGAANVHADHVSLSGITHNYWILLTIIET